MTRPAATEQAYFDWLYSFIGALTDRNPSHSHFLLAEQLHNQAFEWFLPMDEDRARDGCRLRDDFCDEGHPWGDSKFIFSPCTMLEMFIALAKRIDYDTTEYVRPEGVGRIFWHLMDNLGLRQYTDEVYMAQPQVANAVKMTLTRVNARTYEANGAGGIFPLRNPRSDQREVDLWYQAAWYILENSDIAE